MIYLDNAATTYPKPECVYKSLDEANRTLAFNSGRGSYKEAKMVSDMIEDTRRKVASIVGLGPETVSFESSATEAMNIIINGLDLQEGDNVYISPFEHNAIVRPLYNLQKVKHINIRQLPFNKETWDIDEKKTIDMFSLYKPKACFLTHVNNVTGYILPVGVFFALSKRYNCINILDCAQSFGVLDIPSKDADFMVFAGHKSLYSSFGVAGFINKNEIVLNVSKSGGTGSDSLNVFMPEKGNARYESGSLNSIAIAGLNQSIDWLRNNDVYHHEKELTKLATEQLSSMTNVSLYLPKNKNIFGIISFNVDGYAPEDVGSILYDEFEICVRTGYHCCPFIHSFIGSDIKKGTVRISLGAFSTKEDIYRLVEAIKTL